MKEAYRIKAHAIADELRRVQAMCNELQQEIGNDPEEDCDDHDYTMIDDGGVFIDNALDHFSSVAPVSENAS